MAKIEKRKINFNTLFWLTILIIYESPTLVFLGSKTGVGKQVVYDSLGVEVKIKSSWYPSPYFYWERLFSQESSHIQDITKKISVIHYIKHNFLFPLLTDFDSIIFSKSDHYGNLEFVKARVIGSEETAFGEVWEIYDERPKRHSYLVPNHNLKIQVSNPSSLNEIILIRQFK